MGNLVFVRLPHVEHADVQGGIIQSFFHFLDRDFVGLELSVRRFGRNAAELVVIDQLGNGGVFPAKRTFRIAAELQFAKLHIQSIEKEQPANQRRSFPQRQL